MIVSHKHKFIFFCNGKTATTSIEAALSRFDDSISMNGGAPGLWANKHIPPAVARGFFPETLWNEYFKFVFVRHPTTWVLSQARYNFKPLALKARILKAALRPQEILLSTHQEKRKQRILKDGISLTDVDFLFEHLLRFRGLPLASGCYQSNYVYDMNGNKVVDYVGRYEVLEDDISEISSRIGLSIEVPHLNASLIEQKADTETSPSVVQRIQELYAPDFICLKYSNTSGGSGHAALGDVLETIPKDCQNIMFLNHDRH